MIVQGVEDVVERLTCTLNPHYLLKLHQQEYAQLTETTRFHELCAECPEIAEASAVLKLQHKIAVKFNVFPGQRDSAWKGIGPVKSKRGRGQNLSYCHQVSYDA